MLAHGQSQRHGQGLLVLQAAGVELGPELDLQLPVLLLGELELRHAALQLQEDDTEEEEDKVSAGRTVLPWPRPEGASE